MAPVAFAEPRRREKYSIPDLDWAATAFPSIPFICIRLAVAEPQPQQPGWEASVEGYFREVGIFRNQREAMFAGVGPNLQIGEFV